MFGVKYGSGSFTGISVVKRAPASAGDSFNPRLRRSPGEGNEMATRSSILPWRIS